MKLAGLALLLGVCALLSLGIGRYPVPVGHTLMILLEPLTGQHDVISQAERQVIMTVRVPRVLLAMGAGAALALCGAALQGVFRNPLVDPHIIGVSSGAAFGGTLAILLSLPIVGLLLSAFTFGMAALLLIFGLTSAMARRNILSLVLAGVILSGFFSACVSLLQYLADTEEKLPSIVFWLLGSFATADGQKLMVLFLTLLPAGGMLLALRWRINLLSLGDEDAATLGVNVERTRWLILLLCAALVAAQVAVSGSIGWVGLVIPHLARLLVGPDHRRLLPASLCLGALYMVLIDDLARTLGSGEIPLGILTALIGAPLFALLLRRMSLRGWHG
ncbi:ABC-type Fe3+-siderophore transport system, permease component [Serratia sp. FGI94]|uniref:FecCD family ABC transporter permease n=1 Tax=Serratia sp. FGI94 TaxID=671990 RepID=UPI0002A71855|nr:iron ABC transporter permease [Serratia sp. FGI94]AGB81605.1 ABC-type Fe3+-siderophore transport system, permease component [Serratia sp. FGI94]